MNSFTQNMRIRILIVCALFVLCVPCSVFAATTNADIGTFTPSVPLPGLASITICSGDVCDGLAQYVAVAYRFLMGFAAVLAVLIFVWAGIRWMIAGAGGGIKEAQKSMQNALIGLSLALTSYLLLWTINPDLVKLPSLKIKGFQALNLEIEKKEAALEDEVEKMAVGTGSPLSGTADGIRKLQSDGKLLFKCVGDGSCSAKNSGAWNQGLAGISSGTGNKAVDPRILGAIEMIAKTCGPITIQGLNEKSGHSKNSRHYSGQAVDIGGSICGAHPNTCTDRQKQLVKQLQGLGYGVGTPQGSCGGFEDTSGHFHIQIK